MQYGELYRQGKAHLIKKYLLKGSVLPEEDFNFYMKNFDIHEIIEKVYKTL